MAAVLACGPDALLSYRAAIALWELRPVPSGPIDVTVANDGKRSRNGIRVHNTRTVHDDDRATLDGIPVTDVHRALLDYAEIARLQQLRHAVEAADRRDLLDGRKLTALYGRSRGRRGLRSLRAAMAELTGPAPWTQSELERGFLALIRDARLPEPQTNVLLCGHLVDCWWPQARLVVQLDGYLWHKTRRSFEDDRRTDAELAVSGIRSVRFTEPRVRSEGASVVTDVTRLLRAAPGASAAGR